MDSFLQTGIIERFRAENQKTWGGDLEGIIILRINQCYSCTCCPHHPHPPDLRRGLSFRFARLVIDAQWWVGKGVRARERERGRRTIDQAETGRERREEGGDGPAPLGLGHSLLLSAINGIGTQNGLELEYAQKGTEERLVAVTELHEDHHGRDSVCRKAWTNCERKEDSWRFCAALSSKTSGLTDLGRSRRAFKGETALFCCATTWFCFR